MNFQLLLAFAAPYRNRLLLAGLLMLTEAGAALSTPWLAGLFAQEVISSGSAGASALLLSLLVLFAVQSLLRYANAIVTGHTFAYVLADLRVRIYDHLQSLPLSYFHQRRRGEILALITHQVSQLAGFIAGTLLSLAPQLLTVAGAVILMLRIDARLTILVAALVPVFFIVLKLLGRHVRPLAVRLQDEESRAVAIADENLTMLPAIKTFTREETESGRYLRQIDAIRQLSIRQTTAYSSLQPAAQFIAASAAVLLLWLVSDKVSSGQMAAADLVSFLLYAALLTRPVSALAGTYGQLLMARGTLARLHGMLTEPPEPISQVLNELPPVKGGIEFRDVQFSYPGRPPAIDNLNLRIAAGQTVALTGENGAGKSTLAHLLMRLHEPQAGSIFIDGVDIANVGLHSLRRQIGIVPQHVLLFNGSARDNIAYGLAGADEAAIERASRLAQAHEFIIRLPDAYDTLIGDHGVRLSGGQRQRIALARALLKDPPILILDEATAMFDPEAEAAFIRDCRHTLGERTVILITHRPASLALADQVVRLHHGHVSNSNAGVPDLATTC